MFTNRRITPRKRWTCKEIFRYRVSRARHRDTGCRAKVRRPVCYLANVNHPHDGDFVDKRVCCLRSSLPRNFYNGWYYLYNIPPNFSTTLLVYTHTVIRTHPCDTAWQVKRVCGGEKYYSSTLRPGGIKKNRGILWDILIRGAMQPVFSRP